MEMTTKSGLSVVLDDDRADLAALRGWYMHSCGYIGREVRVEGKRKIVFLHHLVLDVQPQRGMRVDHRNRNVLDNRRENLRVVTASENAQNRPQITSRGTHRGVSYHKGKGKWIARATVNYVTHQIGAFKTAEEAAEAVSKWRAEHMTHSDADR